MEIVQIPVMVDNYVYLLRSDQGEVAIVDAGVAEPVRRELHKRGWTPNFIWNTHHHRDHIGANLALQKEFSLEIYGSKKDRARIPGIQKEFSDGDRFLFGSEEVHVFSVDGHTLGHIAFWIPSSNALFCGDTIFSLGCGKLFEGSAQQMWASLEKLRALPDATRIYCAHEYTQENALFAVKAEPGNKELLGRIGEVNLLRSEGRPTVPSTMAEEKKTNPFLRPESREIQKYLGVSGKSNWEIFGLTREAKDRFDQSSV